MSSFDFNTFSFSALPPHPTPLNLHSSNKKRRAEEGLSEDEDLNKKLKTAAKESLKIEKTEKKETPASQSKFAQISGTTAIDDALRISSVASGPLSTPKPTTELLSIFQLIPSASPALNPSISVPTASISVLPSAVAEVQSEPLAMPESLAMPPSPTAQQSFDFQASVEVPPLASFYPEEAFAVPPQQLEVVPVSSFYPAAAFAVPPQQPEVAQVYQQEEAFDYAEQFGYVPEQPEEFALINVDEMAAALIRNIAL